MNNLVSDASKQKMRIKQTREGTYRLQKSVRIDQKRLGAKSTKIGNKRTNGNKLVGIGRDSTGSMRALRGRTREKPIGPVRRFERFPWALKTIATCPGMVRGQCNTTLHRP
jgi:hypothetical protein